MKMRAKDLVNRVSRNLRPWRTIIQVLSYIAIIINTIVQVIHH
jgi:hypothetical protein